MGTEREETLKFDPEVKKIEGKGVLVFGQDQRRMEGGFDGRRAFKGEIFDVKIYKRVLGANVLEEATSASGVFPATANGDVEINTGTVKLFRGAILNVN